MTEMREEITRLLQLADQGNVDAANRLYPLVEEDLKRIARKRKRSAHADARGDVDTTVLVHDAYLRIVGKDDTTWAAGDRRKFFGYIARKMHDVLLDMLREQNAQKRGGGVGHEAVEADLADGRSSPLEHMQLLMDLNACLDRMHAFAPDDVLVFRVKYFFDWTFEEVSKELEISKTEASRAYQRTILWLRRELKEYQLDA